MAKRSNKRIPQQNKDQAGCMSGLISIFDFRHGRTTRRLLSDKKPTPKNTVASTYPTSEVNLLTSCEERNAIIENVSEGEKPTLDVVKPSVKELMEEEMVVEASGDEKVESFGFENLDLVVSRCQDPSQKGSNFSDLEPLMKEILMIYRRRNDRTGDLDVGVNRSFSIVEEKLSAAVEDFMNEKLRDGDHEKTRRSKDFIDTFQMLSSNKELFLKLLQDQNQDSNGNDDEKSKSTPGSSPLETEPTPDRKHRNFFRRRSKSNDGQLHSSRIVILKPNSLDNRLKTEDEVRNERIPSHFSFMEIKKRLKNVMGKEQRKPGFGEKPMVEGTGGWSSPNRDHFYTERFAKRAERVSKLREKPETETEQRENDSDSSGRVSGIYVEAKKHLSEMLSGGDEDAELLMESLPKALGKIISFPEYDFVSPGSSSRKEDDREFVTEKSGVSSCGNFLTDYESQPCESSVDLEDESRVSDEVNRDGFVGGIPDTSMEETNLEGDLQIEEPRNQEEVEVLDVSCEPCSSLETIDGGGDDDDGDDDDDDDDDNKNDEIVEISDEERSPRCLESDSNEETEFSSPMGSSLDKKIEEPESNASDKSERPSPISVLEPLFSDNEISPANTISRPVEAGIQPLCIRFEDQETCSRNCTENEESVFEYVEAVLLASDLNWDEFEKRWLSSVQILDSSLFDEVEIFSSRPSHDQRLFFDSTNEILKEVCDRYLNFYLRLSFIKENVQPVPKGEDLINEVWERIEFHLKNNYPLSLDRLVKKDLGTSKTWMDIRSISREIVFGIDEIIFEDMMDDTLLSIVDDCIRNES